MDSDTPLLDVAVIGGGPAGISAALWTARYRRRVALIDAGQPRNRWSDAAHGYLGFDGAKPATILDAALADLRRYPEITHFGRHRVTSALRQDGAGFRLTLDDGVQLDARRLVLATGVGDVFPDVDGFEQYFGRSIVTCPGCDGYEAQGKVAVVVGEGDATAEFAIGVLNWASSVVWVHEQPHRVGGVEEIIGRVVSIDGQDGQVRALCLEDGRRVPCEVVFWLLRHVQQSDLADRLGCAMTDEGVVVDKEGATTAEHVYAAGDMTPGPHLVQVAAAEGATAGIAAAASLRSSCSERDRSG